MGLPVYSERDEYGPKFNLLQTSHEFIVRVA